MIQYQTSIYMLLTLSFQQRKQYTLYIMNSTIKCEIADILASEPGLDNCVPGNMKKIRTCYI